MVLAVSVTQDRCFPLADASLFYCLFFALFLIIPMKKLKFFVDALR